MSGVKYSWECHKGQLYIPFYLIFSLMTFYILHRKLIIATLLMIIYYIQLRIIWFFENHMKQSTQEWTK